MLPRSRARGLVLSLADGPGWYVPSLAAPYVTSLARWVDVPSPVSARPSIHHARIALTTLPCTSVSRKSRPWN